MRLHGDRGPARAQQGMVLMGVLVALALAALVASEAGQRLADSRQRDAEADLLFIGEQYRQAIESYWLQGPSGVRSLPRRVEDLVNDTRFPVPRRHLRKAWTDPLAPGRPLALVRQGEGLVGVYSEAPGQPFLRAGPALERLGLTAAAGYDEWRFLARLAPAQPAAMPGGAAPSTTPGTGTTLPRPLPPSRPRDPR